jgi:hypothetical protein
MNRSEFGYQLRDHLSSQLDDQLRDQFYSQFQAIECKLQDPGYRLHNKLRNQLWDNLYVLLNGQMIRTWDHIDRKMAR